MKSRNLSRSPSWPSQPHGLETEHRLTRLEVVSEDHGETLDNHAERHADQAIWNRGFSVALAGLAAGLAHAKADNLADFLTALLRGLRP